jgi:hypothetical protein
VNERLRFAAYCVELYKSAKDMTGREVFELFRASGAWEYLWDCFDALHTTGPEYTTGQIDAYLASPAVHSLR